MDSVEERLAKAEELGATPIDFAESDPVEQIFQLRKKNRGIQEGLRPDEEKMQGVESAIDAVGYRNTKPGCRDGPEGSPKGAAGGSRRSGINGGSFCVRVNECAKGRIRYGRSPAHWERDTHK